MKKVVTKSSIHTSQNGNFELELFFWPFQDSSGGRDSQNPGSGAIHSCKLLSRAYAHESHPLEPPFSLLERVWEKWFEARIVQWVQYPYHNPSSEPLLPHSPVSRRHPHPWVDCRICHAPLSPSHSSSHCHSVSQAVSHVRDSHARKRINASLHGRRNARGMGLTKSTVHPEEEHVEATIMASCVPEPQATHH